MTAVLSSCQEILPPNVANELAGGGFQQMDTTTTSGATTTSQPDMPFYLIRPKPAEETLNGSTNLILHNDRQHAFTKYCCKKVKEPLSAFLPDFPGNINTTSFFVSGDEAKETR